MKRISFLEYKLLLILSDFIKPIILFDVCKLRILQSKINMHRENINLFRFHSYPNINTGSKGETKGTDVFKKCQNRMKRNGRSIYNKAEGGRLTK